MESNETYIPITLWIAERGYRIKIKKSDEEVVRMAAKGADQRLAELRRHFDGKDDQDYLAMCLLMYATDQVTEPLELTPLQQDKIKSFIADIDEVLS